MSRRIAYLISMLLASAVLVAACGGDDGGGGGGGGGGSAGDEAGTTEGAKVIDPASMQGASGTVTESFSPSKESARPKRPLAVRVAPETVPRFPKVLASFTVTPEVSLNE